ncbi:YggS family pyridoxal phosphate-dependent enzyme [Campylobacter lanienae]|uniref:YggS family pyridoxal phosphate-dependent enzyme n=1 Tax=Campylobacter lanienae TaxID=75658 RepID=UPI00242AF2EB|nr:YggS family pyridoxal phosphate-dependent enzyme [Campylobacter lanienae]MCI5540371.1 YggS family pyridoxal phosphate-dependent enzyme [Campylobacter lanienae]MDD7515059.1 YggS family pyridoxal phosphate-dependent enzyme [Campylobacter lanienae]MDY5519549.1 YggS family pyridoxal phosphate-dependent enzyme [Campylobacter lanienae]MDY6134823.1 YggS family pyridoxal phosphate-dependent enzyme [Campylobacter lanienae]
MSLDTILNQINGKARLIAVSKNVTQNEVISLYNQGLREFGENRVQELKRKSEILSNLDIKWHFIGRLQSNKINQLISLHPSLWQSCDGIEIALEVNKRLNYKLDTLLQINSAKEESKQGVDPSDAIEIYKDIQNRCENLNLIGVMSIGANSDDENEIKRSFEITKNIFDKLKPQGALICSMGMSGDFNIAIECGSNMVRLGTILYR